MFLAAESFDFVGDSRGNPLVALRNLLRDHATTRRNQMSNKPAPNEPTGGNAGSSVSSAPLVRWGRTLACGCLTWLLTDVRIPAQDLPRFRERVISKAVKFGYQLVTADLNGDGKKDLIAIDERATEVAWFENPTWERHVLATAGQ